MGEWRRGPESNRPTWICNPVHNRFATAPHPENRARTNHLGACPEKTTGNEKGEMVIPLFGKSGAGEESRTLDLNLGKVALYQLSYSRVVELCIIANSDKYVQQNRAENVRAGKPRQFGAATVLCGLACGYACLCAARPDTAACHTLAAALIYTAIDTSVSSAAAEMNHSPSTRASNKPMKLS